MKIQNITNIEKFFEVVDSCEGKVELVTGEGDRLNLKSKLSQYVSMAKLFSDGTISELELLAYEPEDINKLVNFMMNN
ncbi:uncharacterized protein BN526_01929 [Firmicutes bacterium CAG:194]|jgi:hypothetical protein|nr:polya polymerase [Bacillota bacterium]MDD6694866.1 polya polymerase [Bacillota bacterium]MDY3770109.1 polya polymerase [Lachnospiraceae bacterium]CCZ29564.1 uncharacterized protein BN526_01929 [Firmicutes bacterium CAG:194]